MRRWVCLGVPAHAGAHRLDEHRNSVESDRIYVAMPLCWFLGDEGDRCGDRGRTPEIPYTLPAESPDGA